MYCVTNWLIIIYRTSLSLTFQILYLRRYFGFAEASVNENMVIVCTHMKKMDRAICICQVHTTSHSWLSWLTRLRCLDKYLFLFSVTENVEASAPFTSVKSSFFIIYFPPQYLYPLGINKTEIKYLSSQMVKLPKTKTKEVCRGQSLHAQTIFLLKH